MPDCVTINGLTLYTVAGVARELGVHHTRAARIILSRGVGRKLGPITVVTADELEKLRDRKPGRRIVLDS